MPTPSPAHLIQRLRARAADLLAPGGDVARIAMSQRPVYSSWGGGSQWLLQMVRHLRACGYSVRFDLRREVDCILVTHKQTTFSLEELKAYVAERPRVRVIHRINDNDIRKSSKDMDRRLADFDSVASHTVFVSQWLRDYHAERWFDTGRPHSVIHNGADPSHFHPLGAAAWAPPEPLRLVTHHWSDNWAKGFKVYEQVDAMIADGALPGVELWVIGRWPQEIAWRAARIFGAVNGAPLGRLLRQCHAYITASLWEPGAMHFVEGAQCGLPVIYHEDGGGTPEVARHFGTGFRDDPAGAIQEMMARHQEFRAALLANPPSGDQMAVRYRRVVQHALDALPPA